MAAVGSLAAARLRATARGSVRRTSTGSCAAVPGAGVSEPALDAASGICSSVSSVGRNTLLARSYAGHHASLLWWAHDSQALTPACCRIVRSSNDILLLIYTGKHVFSPRQRAKGFQER